MCGVVGIVGKGPVNQQIYDALLALQHRGQDSAGIVTCDGTRVEMRKHTGLVREVFADRHMRRLAGHVGIGHVRYPTAGSYGSDEAQPMYVNSPYGISLAHNGNLTNARELEEEIFEQDKRHINTGSDSEILLNVFASELEKSGFLRLDQIHVFEAIKGVHRRCRGAYATVAMINGVGIVAFRDPNGIRPLAYGVRYSPMGPEYIIASESCAIETLGYQFVRDIQPGEAVFVSDDGTLATQICSTEAKPHTPCIFEHVYFAREDSILDEVSVYKARLRMGEKLAERILERVGQDHDIDVVIPIPESSRTAAIPLAYALNVKFREGFVKNRYIGRTFIMPGQTERQKSVRLKHNAIALEFQDKNVLLVEDFIVRGTTMRQIVKQARDAGAKKVYMAVAAPPVRFPNVYGIDMPAAREFIAYNSTEDEIARKIDVDWLVYQRIDDLISAAAEGNPELDGFECSVFDGDYVTGDIDDEYLDVLQRDRNDVSKRHRQMTEGEQGVIELHNHA